MVDLPDADRGIAAVDVEGARRNVSLQLLMDDEPVAAGDWVLVHLGFAMAKLDEDEAHDILRFLEGPAADGG